MGALELKPPIYLEITCAWNIWNSNNCYTNLVKISYVGTAHHVIMDFMGLLFKASQSYPDDRTDTYCLFIYTSKRDGWTRIDMMGREWMGMVLHSEADKTTINVQGK